MRKIANKHFLLWIYISKSHKLWTLKRIIMADKANLKPPTVFYGDQTTCPSCKEPMTNKLSTAQCGHSACYDCLKLWGNHQIQQGNSVSSSTCPSCRAPMTHFWHLKNRKFTFYLPGQGPKGKLKHPRRKRERKRPKRLNAGAPLGNRA